eukprot:5994262-Amphidinium_carterae.1
MKALQTSACQRVWFPRTSSATTPPVTGKPKNVVEACAQTCPGLQNSVPSALLRMFRVELPVFASPWALDRFYFKSFKSKVREVFHEGLAMEVLSSFHPVKPMPLPKCKTDILYLIKA